MSEEYHEKSISFLWGLIELDGDWSDGVIYAGLASVVAVIVSIVVWRVLA